ncbi:MAG: squalene/phytoene synthase family protein [Polyangiales bacterium]
MRSDLDAVRVGDDAELLRYCYRVAGTVGIMMCGVVGVRDPAALPHAVDLGVGMQLTNIARDVAEDAGLGQVYLPRTRLAAHGVDAGDVLAGTASREAVSAVVRELLAMAERYYASADLGMRYIPARARLAIYAAARLYRGIGRKLLRRGADALAGRTILGAWERASQLAVAAVAFVVGAPRATHDATLHASLQGLPGADGAGG